MAFREVMILINAVEENNILFTTNIPWKSSVDFNYIFIPIKGTYKI